MSHRPLTSWTPRTGKSALARIFGPGPSTLGVALFVALAMPTSPGQCQEPVRWSVVIDKPVIAAAGTKLSDDQVAERDRLVKEFHERLTSHLNDQRYVRPLNRPNADGSAAAPFIASPRLFVHRGGLRVTTRLLGTETSDVSVVFARTKENGQQAERKGDQNPRGTAADRDIADSPIVTDSMLDEVARSLADKIGQQVQAQGQRLTDGRRSADLLEQAMARWSSKIRDNNVHEGWPPVAAILIKKNDPAGIAKASPETTLQAELTTLLESAGFTIRAIDADQSASWSEIAGPIAANRGKDSFWPGSLSGVDVVITGKEIRQFDATVDQLVSCIERAEINVIDRNGGRIHFASRSTARGVATTKTDAGTTASQELGRTLGASLLNYFAATLSPGESTR